MIESNANIFYVSNLRQATDLSELELLFSTVGDVESRRMEFLPESLSGAGFGVFSMATAEQARDCVERFNGTSSNGQRLFISVRRPEIHTPAAPVRKRRTK